MPVTYFHRYRMQYDLRDGLFTPQAIPAGYTLVPWNEELLDQHADVKFQSFRNELDASVFPCLGDRDGCQRLMREISCRQGFLPESTWLIKFAPTNHEDAPQWPRSSSSRTNPSAQPRSSNNVLRNVIGRSPAESCGTVQGIRFQTDVGTIQNIGVTEAHRGKGLGSLLVYHCLRGFEEAGVKFVNLEVTSHNVGAFKLYQRLGFNVLKTVFKSVEINY